VKPTTYSDKSGVERSAVMCYFVKDDGKYFKALYPYEPYLYLKVEDENVRDLISELNKMYENQISSMDYLDKVDLDQANHLSGQQAKYLKLNFKKVEDLIEVKRSLSKVIYRDLEDITKKESEGREIFNNATA
jgi:DNA polymerase epsilon subunit 1